MAVAQELESLAVNQEIRVRIPAATPHIHTTRTRQSRRTIGLQNRVTRCKSGVRVQLSGTRHTAGTGQLLPIEISG